MSFFNRFAAGVFEKNKPDPTVPRTLPRPAGLPGGKYRPENGLPLKFLLPGKRFYFGLPELAGMIPLRNGSTAFSRCSFCRIVPHM